MILPWNKVTRCLKITRKLSSLGYVMSFIATDSTPCITVLNISMITPPAPTTEESRASDKHSYNLASGVRMLPLCSMIITE